jgi:hypothetical protein
MEFPEPTKCEGTKGTHVCGRRSELLLTDTNGDVYYSCLDCVGRLMVEKDLDDITVERIYV